MDVNHLNRFNQILKQNLPNVPTNDIKCNLIEIILEDKNNLLEESFISKKSILFCILSFIMFSNKLQEIIPEISTQFITNSTKKPNQFYLNINFINQFYSKFKQLFTSNSMEIISFNNINELVNQLSFDCSFHPCVQTERLTKYIFDTNNKLMIPFYKYINNIYKNTLIINGYLKNILKNNKIFNCNDLSSIIITYFIDENVNNNIDNYYYLHYNLSNHFYYQILIPFVIPFSLKHKSKFFLCNFSFQYSL